MLNEITYSPFEPRTMGEVVRRLPPLHTFFLSTFFKRKKTFVTKSVDVDFKKGNRALAPFVHPRMGGKTMPNTGFQTKNYTPPYIAPDKITTVDDLVNRQIGENIYSGKTPAQRAIAKLVEDFTELNEMITRREEWMAAQAIVTGKIPIIGEGLNEVIDFGFTNKEDLPAAKKWSNAASDPIADLKKWRKQVHATGKPRESPPLSAEGNTWGVQIWIFPIIGNPYTVSGKNRKSAALRPLRCLTCQKQGFINWFGFMRLIQKLMLSNIAIQNARDLTGRYLMAKII